MPSNSTSTNFVRWQYQDPPQFSPFWFEEFDYDWWKEYGANNWKLSFYVALIYLIVIFALQQWMKNRTPYKLTIPLILWNMSLAIFSIFGTWRTGAELLNVVLLPDGFYKSLCVRTGLNQPAAFYSVAFALSKYIELGDTVFIVLRKKRLVFLQWYHHFATLILAWQVMPYSEPIFRYYGTMNYGVHSIMYTYFALTVMNIKVPKVVPMIITSSQLLQMIIGVAINVYSMHLLYKYGPESCSRDPVSIKWIGGVYASFMILFAHFFYERYLSKKKKTM